MKPPQVSVLMPVYNAEKYLREAIDSILRQSFSDFEFLITDDGSKDGSESILREYADEDARIRVVSRENRGLVRTLNEMLDRARGEFIARMDGDDISDPTRFKLQVDHLRQNPGCVAVGCAIALIDADGDPLITFSNPTEHHDIDAAHLRGSGGAMPHAATMFRRSAMNAICGYRESYTAAEDVDLFLRLAEVGSLANLTDVLYSYRQHLSSVGYSRRQKQVDEMWQAIAEACSRRRIENVAGNHQSQSVDNSIATQHRRWAWWALGAGHVEVARKHARKGLRLEPLNLESWRVAYCAMRGRQSCE